MKKNVFWIILIAAVAVLSAGAALWLHSHSASGTVANVYIDGTCVRSIDLDALKETELFTVSGPVGENTIQAEPGRIRVSHADCPDQVCVHMGWLTEEGGMPIVCLPNHLVIRLENAAPTVDGAEIDGVVG